MLMIIQDLLRSGAGWLTDVNPPSGRPPSAYRRRRFATGGGAKIQGKVPDPGQGAKKKEI